MLNKLCLFAFILTLILVPNLKTIHNTSWYQKMFPEAISSEPEPIKEVLVTLNPKLKPVCGCESAYTRGGEPQQFEKDGVTVRLGRINKLDTGMCMINQKYHLKNAISMGLDIFTEQGNIKYANWLYSQEGVTPWLASSACWGKGLDYVGDTSIMNE